MLVQIKELPSKNPNQVARTLVGNEVVSTIFMDSTLLMMDSAISDLGDALGISAEDVGHSDLRTPGDYETMVFECDEDGEVLDWQERDFNRYFDSEEATRGHGDMVQKRLDLQTKGE